MEDNWHYRDSVDELMQAGKGANWLRKTITFCFVGCLDQLLTSKARTANIAIKEGARFSCPSQFRVASF